MTISNASTLNSTVFAAVTDRRLTVDESGSTPKSNVIPPPAEASAAEQPNQERLPNRFAEQAPAFDSRAEQSSNESSNREPSTPPEEVGAAALKPELNNQEQALVRDLAIRDREVRAHEAAHSNVGGQYAGAVSLTLARGPDGQNYAVAGEVPIDISAIPNDPAATIAKAQVVRRAALAPSQPSSADRAIATQATAVEQQARAELAAESVEAPSPESNSNTEQDSGIGSEPASSALESTPLQRGAEVFTAIAAGSSDPAAAQRSIDIII